jgi:hypothetical protein
MKLKDNIDVFGIGFKNVYTLPICFEFSKIDSMKFCIVIFGKLKYQVNRFIIYFKLLEFICEG